MMEQKNQNIDFRVFHFRSIEKGVPEVNESYLDIRLNFNNWMRYVFFLKEYFVYEDFYKLYKNTRFDLLHAHTLFSNGYIAYKYKKKTGVPYIVAVRDTDLNVFFKYRFYLRKLGIDILKNSERIVFISDNYRQTLLDSYVSNEDDKKIINEKSVVIPNGISPFFHENSFFKKKPIKSSQVTIITVGHIIKRKNQLSVCKAINKLRNDGYNIRYLVVGKILDQEYFNKVSKYSFVEYKEYTQDRNQLIGYYRDSDIFVMPSITETFGLTYVEAMTQGLPIVYSKGQGIESYLNQQNIGESVDAHDINDIYLKIKKIMLSKSDYKKNLYEVVKLFKWTDIISEYKEIYIDVERKSYENKKK